MAEDAAVWSIVFQQQALAGVLERAQVKQLLDELATGLRTPRNSAISTRIGRRTLRRGTTENEEAVVLWTTDFAYDGKQLYTEVIQVWGVCSGNDEERQVCERLAALWQGKSLRNEASLARVVTKPRLTEKMDNGCSREFPRSIPHGADADMSWLAKFFQFPPELCTRWVDGSDVLWDRLPIIGTEEQQRCVSAPGPLVLVGRAGSGKSLVLRDRLWRHYIDSQRLQMPRRQVFLTLSPALARSAQQQFSEAQHQYFPMEPPTPSEEDLDLQQGLSALPEAPVFLTVRSYLKLLCFELGAKFFAGSEAEAEFEGAATALPGGGKRVEITYMGFVDHFWHRARARARSLDPLLVWAEIQSSLKGFHFGHPLTMADYCELGKKQAVGLAGERENIFKVFEEYQRFCKQNRCFDRMDLAQHLLASLREAEIKGPWVDWLYVDEVQDLSQVELEVILQTVKDLKGVAVGGDTTQTVSQGVSFRFCDLDTALQKEAKARRVRLPPAKQWAELTVNHRSHKGLVDLSNVFVHILEQLFPWTVDKLQPARSSISGPCPEAVPCEYLGSMSLGAEQVVLVPSRCVQLPGGLRGIVATPAEAKGLEYTDVILLDWWKHTPHRKLWEEILKMEDKLLLSWGGSDEDGKSWQTWQTAKYMPLSKELKQLFVAVTRAQHSLIILSSGCDLTDRVCDFLARLNVVRRSTDTVDAFRNRAAAQQLARAFIERGELYFGRQLFDLAIQAFRLALIGQGLSDGDRNRLTEKVQVCEGQMLMRQARGEEGVERRNHFLEAAEKFEGIPRFVRDRAVCLHEAAEVEEDRVRHLTLLLDAAKCYRCAGEKLLAAATYERAGKYFEADELYRELRRYEDAARCLLLRIPERDNSRPLLFQNLAQEAAEVHSGVPVWVQDRIKNEKWWLEGVEVAKACGAWELQAKWLKEAKEYKIAGNLFESEKLTLYLQAAECYYEIQAGEGVEGLETLWARAATIFEEHNTSETLGNAADLRKRLQEFSHAGRLYEKSHQPKVAAECFEQTGEELDAARCRESNSDFDIAAAIFKRHSKYEDAKRVTIKSARQAQRNGDYVKAALKWEEASNPEECAKAWEKAGEAVKKGEAEKGRQYYCNAVLAWWQASEATEAESPGTFLSAVRCMNEARLGNGHVPKTLVPTCASCWEAEVNRAKTRGHFDGLWKAFSVADIVDSVEQSTIELLRTSSRQEEQQMGEMVFEMVAKPLLEQRDVGNLLLQEVMSELLVIHILHSNVRDTQINVFRVMTAVQRTAAGPTADEEKALLRAFGVTPEEIGIVEILARQLGEAVPTSPLDLVLPRRYKRRFPHAKDLPSWPTRFVQVERRYVCEYWRQCLANPTLAALPHVDTLGSWHSEAAEVITWCWDAASPPVWKEALRKVVRPMVQDWSTARRTLERLFPKDTRTAAAAAAVHECLKAVRNLGALDELRVALLTDCLRDDVSFAVSCSLLQASQGHDASPWVDAMHRCPDDWDFILVVVLPHAPVDEVLHHAVAQNRAAVVDALHWLKNCFATDVGMFTQLAHWQYFDSIMQDPNKAADSSLKEVNKLALKALVAEDVCAAMLRLLSVFPHTDWVLLPGEALAHRRQRPPLVFVHRDDIHEEVWNALKAQRKNCFEGDRAVVAATLHRRKFCGLDDHQVDAEYNQVLLGLFKSYCAQQMQAFDTLDQAWTSLSWEVCGAWTSPQPQNAIMDELRTKMHWLLISEAISTVGTHQAPADSLKAQVAEACTVPDQVTWLFAKYFGRGRPALPPAFQTLLRDLLLWATSDDLLRASPHANRDGVSKGHRFGEALRAFLAKIDLRTISIDAVVGTVMPILPPELVDGFVEKAPTYLTLVCALRNRRIDPQKWFKRLRDLEGAKQDEQAVVGLALAAYSQEGNAKCLWMHRKNQMAQQADEARKDGLLLVSVARAVASMCTDAGLRAATHLLALVEQPERTSDDVLNACVACVVEGRLNLHLALDWKTPVESMVDRLNLWRNELNKWNSHVLCSVDSAWGACRHALEERLQEYVAFKVAIIALEFQFIGHKDQDILKDFGHALKLSRLVDDSQVHVVLKKRRIAWEKRKKVSCHDHIEEVFNFETLTVEVESKPWQRADLVDHRTSSATKQIETMRFLVPPASWTVAMLRKQVELRMGTLHQWHCLDEVGSNLQDDVVLCCNQAEQVLFAGNKDNEWVHIKEWTNINEALANTMPSERCDGLSCEASWVYALLETAKSRCMPHNNNLRKAEGRLSRILQKRCAEMVKGFDECLQDAGWDW